jgi:hypothetical protein
MSVSNRKFLTTLLAFTALCATSASAAPFVYSNFASTAGLQLNGNAATAIDGSARSVLRLTPSTSSQSGSAFSTSLVALTNNASFSTFFNFNMNTPGGDGDGQGADGITFSVQSVSSNAGGAGGGIGYAGIGNSIAVEFDTYNNGEPGGGNHVGIDVNGSVTSVTSIAVSPRLNNGTDWSAWVDYDSSTSVLEVRLVNGLNALRPLAALLSHNINLASVLGQNSAYVGFTSGTGAGYNNHDIISWQFNDDFAPIGAPAPGAIELLGLALLGFGLLSARRVQRAAATTAKG